LFFNSFDSLLTSKFRYRTRASIHAPTLLIFYFHQSISEATRRRHDDRHRYCYLMGEMDEMDALVKDRLDQELDSLVPTADGPAFAATLEGLLAKSWTRFEGRGAMHRRATS
jgi:hypothetical protein